MAAPAISVASGPIDLPRIPIPRLGLIVLATDLTTEGDVARLIAPSEVAVHATRVAYANPTTPESLRGMGPRLAEAAALLVPGEPLAAITYCCTSASVVIGEAQVAAAVGAGRPGVPVVTPIGATMKALRALGARRISVLTPYLEETTAPVVAYLEAAGFEVMRAHCLGMEDDRQMARVSGAAIIAAARETDGPDAEALFISCTALPALAVVARIEAALGKPVVTSNQACIWEMRGFAGLTAPVNGFGRLFECVPTWA